MAQPRPPNSAAAAAQNQQQQQAPTPYNWLAESLTQLNQWQQNGGGHIAQRIHTCGLAFRPLFANNNNNNSSSSASNNGNNNSNENNNANSKALQEAIDFVSNLPPNNPPQTLASRCATVRKDIVRTFYNLYRSFLRCAILYRDQPRERVLNLLEGYREFAAFHQQDRDTPATPLLALPKSAQLLIGQQQQQQQKKPPQANASGSSNVGWDTAVLVVLVQNIRRECMIDGSLDDDILSDIMRSWRQMFLFLVRADPTQPNNIARRRGALVVINALVAILFHRGNLHQVRTLLNEVENIEQAAGGDPSKGVLGPCGHIRSEVTKLLYFQGRVRLLQGVGHEVQAAKLFGQCFARMPPLAQLSATAADQSVRNNKLRALFYLLVSAVLSGVSPDPALLEADGFMSATLGQLIGAVNRGSPARLERIMNGYTGVVLRTRGVFINCQSLYLLCTLVAVKRVHSLIAETGNDNSRINLKMLAKAMELFDIAGTEGDEAATLPKNFDLNNKQQQQNNSGGKHNNSAAGSINHLPLIVQLGQLVQNGWIKGYIAFEHDTMVLSKADPFPRRLV